MHPRDQTIFALSSGRPPSAIAIVRLSGPMGASVIGGLAGKRPAPRMATRALLRDSDGQPIDDAVVLWFPGPASATGEDVAELRHGEVEMDWCAASSVVRRRARLEFAPRSCCKLRRRRRTLVLRSRHGAQV